MELPAPPVVWMEGDDRSGRIPEYPVPDSRQLYPKYIMSPRTKVGSGSGWYKVRLLPFPALGMGLPLRPSWPGPSK